MRTSCVKNAAILLLTVIAGTAALSAQTAPAATAQKTATQFYMDYRAAMDKAKKIDDLLPFMSAKNRKEVASTPAADKPKFFEMMKMMSASNVKITKEERSATGATLTAEGLDPMEKKKTTGKITIIKEEGAWKLGEESWGN